MSEPNSAAQRSSSSTGRFQGKTVLITGASDRGIGGAIAKRLAAEGAAIFVLGLEQPHKLLRRIEKKQGRIEFMEGDICKSDDNERAVARCVESFGSLDVLVNNAGIDLAGELTSYTDEVLQRLIDVNLTGMIKTSRAALPHLTSPAGVVVNLASATGLGGASKMAAYSASKAGVIGFTQSLAMELAPSSRRCVAVAPGMVLTPMTRQHLGDVKAQGVDATVERIERVQQSHPLGVGLPEDVAAAVAFLASEEARWISGITLPMGWSPTYDLPTDLLIPKS